MADYLKPDRPLNRERDEVRRVGIEIEFAGLPMEETGATVAEALGGTWRVLNQAEGEVEVPDAGTFKIELDWQLGKVMARSELASDHEEVEAVVDWVTSTASELVPMEVVCPPLPLDGLHLLDPMVQGLRQAGALGTSASPLFAFGVHLNPELPDLSPGTITGYLKAFCLAQDWLVAAHGVDLSRRLTPYVDLFPDDYVDRVLSYEGEITLETLIDDYTSLNPTRNRALDMTPLFRHLDEARLLATIDDARINARPTFHYRLPNSEIENDTWSLSRAWNLWCVVEWLSEQPDLMAEMTRQRQARTGQLVSLDSPPWHDRLDQAHNDLLSA